MAALFLYRPALACVAPPMYANIAPTVATPAVNRAIWLIMPPLPCAPSPCSAACCVACSSSWSCGPWTWNPAPDMSFSVWCLLVRDETEGQAVGRPMALARHRVPGRTEGGREGIALEVLLDLRHLGHPGQRHRLRIQLRAADDPGPV